MTAATETCSAERGEDMRPTQTAHRDETVHVPLMVAKNLLFWGSISLSIYALYALAAAL
ncbi:hypothetical protein [Labrenzia sp. 011]|uniref:hypothetical protein n=1 Tax=Labrenzia sp. 011 TaxID=2171494 RepID=UPI0014037C7A|nr:hypothetical protein [Labrenzia sp. 011]